MEILERTFQGNSIYQINTAFFEKGIIFLEGEVNSQMANRFVKELGYIQMTNQKAPVKIILDSQGGEIDAGLQIVDAISTCSVPIEVVCIGKAYSMGAIIFESCPGKRKMLPHAKIMLHQPSVIAGSGSRTAVEIETLSNEMKEKSKELLKIVSKRSGITLKTLEKETVTDRYFDAKEAVEKNLVDEIVTFAEVFKNEEA